MRSGEARCGTRFLRDVTLKRKRVFAGKNKPKMPGVSVFGIKAVLDALCSESCDASRKAASGEGLDYLHNPFTVAAMLRDAMIPDKAPRCPVS
jgi:hypothetical protein